jgi:hypothetical protein
MGLELERARYLQEPDAIYYSGRPTDPYYEPLALHDTQFP